MKRKTKNRKKGGFAKGLLILFLVLLLSVLCYAAYVFISYYRVEDNLVCEPEGNTETLTEENRTYSLLSYNIGFGAYEPDFGFFMDGGHESRAFSLERLVSNMNAIGKFIGEQNADFVLLQEVDEHGTRTFHLNERTLLNEAMRGYASVWAQNWDCPYLCYPLYSFHGANRSGLLTFSETRMESSVRRSLPVENSVMKIVDLDRCYQKTRFLLASGKSLVLYNTHLSAYSSDGKIAEEQLKMLLDDMTEEYRAGNYAICAGDMNKDLHATVKQTGSDKDAVKKWAQPIPQSILAENSEIILLDPTPEGENVLSCRDADGPIREGQFRVTVDGFFVSENVRVESAEILDTGFRYSDHNPVLLRFVLAGAEHA